MQVEAARISRRHDSPQAVATARVSWRRRTIAFWAEGWTGFSIEASQVKTAAVKQLCAGTGIRRLDWRIWSGCETALPD